MCIFFILKKYLVNTFVQSISLCIHWHIPPIAVRTILALHSFQSMFQNNCLHSVQLYNRLDIQRCLHYSNQGSGRWKDTSYHRIYPMLFHFDNLLNNK